MSVIDIHTHETLHESQGVSAKAKNTVSVPVNANVPIDYSVHEWSRFLGPFEANEFTNWIDESLSWKKTCYIGDWSPLLKIRVTGPEAKAFFEYISTNHWPTFEAFTGKSAIFCRSKDGAIMGEGVLLKVAEDDYIFTSVPGVPWAMFQFYSGARKFDAELRVVTDDWYLFQVQGPNSVELMEEATGSSLRDLQFMHAREVSINNFNFLCLRQGVSGERGFELWGPAGQGQSVYRAIVEIGEKYGIKRLGRRAKAVNHAEAAFPTPWLDFLPAVFDVEDPEVIAYRHFVQEQGLSAAAFLFAKCEGSYGEDPKLHQRTPYDLGWGWLVNLHPDHHFVGREALQTISASPPNKLVSLEWNSEDVADVYASLFREESFEYMELPRTGNGPMPASSVVLPTEIQNNNGIASHTASSIPIGVAVSRCYSYWFKKMISLAIISREHAVPGKEVIVKWGNVGNPQKNIRAIVKKAPYKEDQRKKPFI
ncbi:glycine cleavage T protein [Coniella lustricola]|uniref:Glycine cleavage T protein n=1 Tax=Coniella lustricola TaxID=2025994 RepID=A0A2T2ZSE2_9PEZI|nr:glycine cleavage T protein [Coniella lustricola]